MFIIVSILVLGFLICIHEIGHFVVAKIVGIHVDEFSIGFGPKLLGFQVSHDSTLYSLRLLPLGGYVKMAGMEPQDTRTNGFNNRPLRDRIAVISAGPLMNFIVAVLLFILTFSFIGIPVPSNSNVIGDVIQGSPASEAGLKPGDRIISVNGVATSKWDDIAENIHKSSNKRTKIEVLRDNRKLTLYVTPQYDPNYKVGQIGIRQNIIWQKQNFFDAVKLGLDRAFGFAQLILHGIFGMATGTVPPKDIAGPVGITQMIGEAAKGGLGYLLSFTAILGINLALVNLLPIPALDGSRLLFLIIEGIRGKALDPKKENFIHLIGFALLIVLIIIITYNDLVRLLTSK